MGLGLCRAREGFQKLKGESEEINDSNTLALQCIMVAIKSICGGISDDISQSYLSLRDLRRHGGHEAYCLDLFPASAAG